MVSSPEANPCPSTTWPPKHTRTHAEGKGEQVKKRKAKQGRMTRPRLGGWHTFSHTLYIHARPFTHSPSLPCHCLTERYTEGKWGANSGLRCYNIPSHVYFRLVGQSSPPDRELGYMGKCESGFTSHIKANTTANIYTSYIIASSPTLLYIYTYYSLLFTSTKHKLVLLQSTYHIYNSW